MIGATLLNFRITRQLGAGGLGAVYEGEHTLIGRKAALKVLHPTVAHDQKLVARFLAEARAVNAIRHPNIVDVTDYGETGEHFVIVMELLEGETLGHRLEHTSRLDERFTLGLLSQLASALAATHEQGIVHRDLKPENLFLTRYPDYPDFLKVLDFGIAKLTRAADSPDRTSPGLIIGTPAYMSPEQCLGDEALDHRSDIYSLGVVAYRMLTGRVPFEGNATQMLQGHLTGTPTPLTAFKVSAPLDALVMRCLRRHADDRFQSMKEVRQALVELGARPPLAFGPDEAPAPPREALQAQPTRASVRPATSTTRPLTSSPGDRDHLQAVALAARLKDVIARRLQADTLKLPSLPEVAMKALELAQDPEVRFATLASALERDPFISSRLMRVANSPLFGGLARANTMEGVVARLGIKQLVALLQELAAEQVFASRDPVIRNAFRGIWEHCLGVGHLARDLSGEVRAIDPNLAYLAGLFHDIGKPIVAALLLELERTSHAAFINGAVWQRVVEECHRDVGAVIAVRWYLPREVARTVAELDGFDLRRGKASCTNVVRLSNALCQREGLDVRAGDPEGIARVIVQGRQLLQLTDEQLERHTAGIVERVQAMTQSATEGDASTRVFDRTAS